MYETGSAITSTGALTAFSGAKTGRSPLDKRIVKEATSENEVWWGPVNRPMTPEVSDFVVAFHYVIQTPSVVTCGKTVHGFFWRMSCGIPIVPRPRKTLTLFSPAPPLSFFWSSPNHGSRHVPGNDSLTAFLYMATRYGKSTENAL